MKFECHLTFPGADASKVQGFAAESGWNFSKITGDPDLGTGARCYMTRHFDNPSDAEFYVKNASKTALQAGLLVLRQKIELIMFDSLHGGWQ